MANRETRRAFLSLLSQIHKHYKIKQTAGHIGFVLKKHAIKKTDNYHSSGNISQDLSYLYTA